MDYEKKYKEALERAKQFSEKPLLEDSAGIVEYIFPELVESEDEKIRKEIRDFICWSTDKGCITKEQVEKSNSWLAWLEKIEHQKEKPADKIEPKFKVGDWIANGIETVQITGYDIDYGYQVDYKGNLLHRDTDVIEKEYHLWAIADAKDGDVLATGNKNIFIFKAISNYTIYDYCGLYFGKFMEYSATVNSPEAVQLPIDYVPATKEQRDLLFQKMKEAGYEWDAENKELKKIEQKSWSE